MKNLKPNEPVRKIVIIGGGFAGLNLAKKLGSSKLFDITLVDKNNYNFFPPLIYQVATGLLDPSNISYPFRKLLRKEHVQFRMAELIKVDVDSKTCYLNNGLITYDYLVFATGAKTNYFGNANIEKNALPMKTVNDALRLRNAVLQVMEHASITGEPSERRRLLTIVVAGGGPTGVEVSGMLAELKKHVRGKDYPDIEDTEGEIYLVDGGSKLIAQMSEKSHKEVYNALVRLGVKIKLNTTVTDFDEGRVILSNGEIIEAETLIWAAGVVATVFNGIPAESIGKGRRMLTDAYNKVEDTRDVYAIGDACIQKSDLNFPTGHPQLAQVAIQQGFNLAKNFIAMSNGKPLTAFKYRDKGSAAIVGKTRAVVDIPKPRLHIGGVLALFTWLFIHLVQLITFRSKIMTLLNWLIVYFTNDQSLRLIIRPKRELTLKNDLASQPQVSGAVTH